MTPPPLQQVVYDIETYPTFFCLVATDLNSPQTWVFEISTRRNDAVALMAWLEQLHVNGAEMIGFNNIGFDYPVIHEFITNPECRTSAALYLKAISLINRADNFAGIIWESDRLIRQLDLYKIHHFDNKARATGLKALQFNMRSESVEDLPFEPGTPLNPMQMDATLLYCGHDVAETKAFAIRSKEAIDLRRALSAKYGRDFMNHNDTKIGKDYFIMQLGDEACYHRVDGRRQPRQTIRASIAIRDVIFPYVTFHHPEFRRIHEWFRDRVITETKGVIDDVTCEINGFTFVFGTGGIHGSVASTVVEADDYYSVWDWDVTSFYPCLAIVNRVYPDHLGEGFCDIYKDVFEQRKQHPKGSVLNGTLKLALNGTYGDSNNQYSPFYDPQYTMTITINGQLSLCMLAESLFQVPGLQMIQVNTDGLTVRLPREYEGFMHAICADWQRVTGLELESAQYQRMCIRDVNNYIAVKTDGKVKLRGAYAYERGWHQDQSALVVPKAAEAAMVRGEDVETFIRSHTDPFDFMCRAKAPRGSRLMLGDRRTQNTLRYYMAVEGDPLTKVSPPVAGMQEGWYKRKNGVSEREYHEWRAAWGNTWNPDIHTGNKSIYETRVVSICAGWKVAECNRASDFYWSNLNREWYIAEARKLILGKD